MRNALEVLTPEERKAIETAFFSELTYEETARKLNQPLGTVKTRIRSGLGKLREALGRKLKGRMNSKPGAHSQEHLDLVFLFALQALSPSEMASVEAQISSCEDCRQEIETLRPIVRSFVGWSTDVLRPRNRYGAGSRSESPVKRLHEPFAPPLEAPVKPEWEEAAPGIHVKILARNAENDSVSMLVRLDPEPIIPDTGMRASKNCIFSMAY